MADITNNTLALLVGVALVVSMVSLFNLPGGITGFATSGTGEARINISCNVAVNITNNLVNFGTGTLSAAVPCELTSEAAEGPGDCWSGSNPSAGLQVQSLSNNNVTITAQSNKAAAAFIGGSSPLFNYKCSQLSGSLTSDAAAYATVTTSALPCVSKMTPNSQLEYDVNLTVPTDAIGYKNATITFAAVTNDTRCV